MAVTSDPTRTPRRFSWRILIKPAVFIICLIPLAMAVYAVASNRMGANPIEGVLHVTGEWGLRFLLITLSVTPLQFTFNWLWVARLRRMLGLYAFFYATLHLTIWVVLDQGLELGTVLREIVEKKYILVGIIALLTMLPLALTSNRWAIRKLGKKWKPLHRLVYPLTLLAIVHFLWQVRAKDVGEPAIYLAIFLFLLALGKS